MYFCLIGYLILSLLFLCSQSSESLKNSIYIEFECYSNHKDENINGNYCDILPSGACDPYFEFCLSSNSLGNAKCNLWEFTSSVYDNMASICGNSRGALRSPKKIPLPGLVPMEFHLTVTIRDKNSLPSLRTRDIAIFESSFSLVPSVFSSPFRFIKLEMSRMEKAYKNNDVKLNIKAAAQCKEHHYGKDCYIRCVPNKERFSCDSEGNKVCEVGWTGSECEMKDFCKLNGCAVNANCENGPARRICRCNGGTEPSCYPGFNYCDASPCTNQGVCYFNESTPSYICACKPHYRGRNCGEYIDPCQEKPCNNSGVCYYSSHFGDIMCNCPNGFYGPRCEMNSPEVFNLPFTSSNRSYHGGGSKSYPNGMIKKEEDTMNISMIAIITTCSFITLVASIISLYCILSYRRKKKATKDLVYNNPDDGYEMPNVTSQMDSATNNMYDGLDMYASPNTDDDGYTISSFNRNNLAAQMGVYENPDDSGRSSLRGPENIYTPEGDILHDSHIISQNLPRGTLEESTTPPPVPSAPRPGPLPLNTQISKMSEHSQPVNSLQTEPIIPQLPERSASDASPIRIPRMFVRSTTSSK